MMLMIIMFHPVFPQKISSCQYFPVYLLTVRCWLQQNLTGASVVRNCGLAVRIIAPVRECRWNRDLLLSEGCKDSHQCEGGAFSGLWRARVLIFKRTLFKHLQVIIMEISSNGSPGWDGTHSLLMTFDVSYSVGTYCAQSIIWDCRHPKLMHFLHNNK